ncbi:MAG TPA: flagellar biosynthesis protein FlhF, partial [Steroidobacteraceae bacterium]|nr:flagellar biosynthesis protein FlhF [Steroidobacteraceae bacterium]
MKIVRHTAPDMRQALRSIREQLGEEAVILSSRRTAEGVEVTAAVDFDAASLEAPVALAAPAAPAAPAARAAPAGRPAPVAPAALAALAARMAPAALVAAVPTVAPAALATPAAAAAAAPAPDPAVLFPPPPEIHTDAMGKELQSLRRILETQLAQLAWNDRTRRAPVHTELLRELTEIGIAQDLADHLVGQLDERVDLTQGRRFAIAGLSQYLLVTGDRWLESGGRVAFVGATGVGKTTMLAKLAVRWILRHGPRDLALVASDTVRIGAQDQMQGLGQLLGVP